MSAIQLKIACMPYEHTRALREGRIKMQGVEANFHTAELPTEIFEPMIREKAFDVAELGLTYVLRLLDRPNSPFVALPVFLARVFRHSAVYINTESGIQTPEDLAGKTIGEFGLYGHDAGIWPKGIFSDEYDWRPEQSRWVIGASDWYMPPLDFVPQPHPANVRVDPVPEDRTLSQMLESGEIDAFFSARAPKAFMEGSPKVARLFTDYEHVEREYYRRTGVFPIMHTLVIRRQLLDSHPELARIVFDAFVAAKEEALNSYRKGKLEMNILAPVPWLTSLLGRNDSEFPQDWWPYGISANRHVLETFTRYFFEQGLSSRRFSIEEIFEPSLLST